MKGKFKLVGLSRSKSITCQTDREDFFWPKVNMAQDRFDALFNYCKDNWDEQKFVEIEFDRLDETGEPINPILLNITL